MKNKIINLILGLAVVVVVNFFTTQGDKDISADFNIAKLISLNTANAEESGGETVCKCNFWGKCKASGSRATCASFSGSGDCKIYNSNC